MTPETLHILGKTWTVKREPEGELGLRADGVCDYDTQVFTIAEKLHPDTYAETLLHEVVHAVDRATACGLTEAQVVSITSGLFAVLRDNPQFGALVCGWDFQEVEVIEGGGGEAN